MLSSRILLPLNGLLKSQGRFSNFSSIKVASFFSLFCYIQKGLPFPFLNESFKQASLSAMLLPLWYCIHRFSRKSESNDHWQIEIPLYFRIIQRIWLHFWITLQSIATQATSEIKGWWWKNTSIKTPWSPISDDPLNATKSSWCYP